MSFSTIENAINNIKEMHGLEAGNELHNQLHEASNAKWSKDDLSDLMLSDDDVADRFFADDESAHADVREVQHSIINFFGE